MHSPFNINIPLGNLPLQLPATYAPNLLVKKPLVHFCQKFFDPGHSHIIPNRYLLSSVPGDGHKLRVLHIIRTYLHTKGNSLLLRSVIIINAYTETHTHFQFPMIELPSRGVVVSHITTATNFCSTQLFHKGLTSIQHCCLLLLCHGRLYPTWDHHNLQHNHVTHI